MHIRYSLLIENTCKSMLMKANPVMFGDGKFATKKKKQMLQVEVRNMKKKLNEDWEMKKNVLNYCKYGKEKSIAMHEQTQVGNVH